MLSGRRVEIRRIVADNPLKQGRYLPGSNIPVVGIEDAIGWPTDAVIIFPWNVADDIEPKIKQHFPGAAIIVPMPDVEVRGG